MKTINSFRSKLLALTLALMASVSTFAYDFEYVNDFHINGFAYKIISVNDPDDGEGYVSLIEIADCKKDVVVPKYVSYGDRGFYVTTFGMGSVVFTNEASSFVESITIPKSTNIINKNALAGCPNLTTVIVDSENPYYDSRENCNAIITTSQNPYITPNTLIAGCKTTIIPNSVVEIGENAFYNCQSLETITIPNSVTKIGRSAFNACSALSSITLSENLTAIGEWAFDDCNNLKEVICYAPQPPTISQYTFSGISPTIYVPAESIERYRAATGWKEFEIRYISWSSEECHEYKHVNLTALPLITGKLTYRLSTDDGSEPPYVDSVWILNTDKEPLQKFYAQSGDTIDLLSLELGHYILRVYIDGCILSRTFVHRPKWKYTWCNQWNVMWFDGMRFDETASTSKYRLGKDTVIGDYIYSKFTSRTSVRFTEDWKVYVYYEGFDDNEPNTPDLPTGEYLAYDFSAQVGDTLEVFSGVHSYSKYKCLVREVQTDPETKLRTITLFQLLLEDTDGDGVEEEYGIGEMTWIEGVGSPNGFLINTTLPGGGLFTLLCAYKDDELKYTGSFYERFGCDYNAGVISDDLFPMLSGLQRTICREYCEQADNKTRIEQFTNLTTRTETGGPYLYCSPFLLREKDNKILIYSRSLNKDLVLYDFNLQVGDSLPMLYIDFFAKDDWIADRDMEIWCIVDYHKDLEGNILPVDTLIVTDVSAITLLDGKEYKKWTFNNGMEYVEGIGSFGNRQWSGDFFQLIANRDVPTSLQGEHLVCVSKNNKLLYMMDDAEMERLGTECLCEVETSYKSQWCDTWNVLDLKYRTIKYTTEEDFETWRYYLAQDTIINNYTYTAVTRQKTKVPEGVYPFTIPEPEYIAAVRFTEDSKVYIYYDNTEYLLYDFNVQPGDELTVFAGINHYHSHHTNTIRVDEVERYPGIYPFGTEISLSVFPDFSGDVRPTCFGVTKWVEGVGDLCGFITGADCGLSEYQTALLCAYKDGNTEYRTEYEEYAEYGCEYNSGENKEYILTLPGLQRTEVEFHIDGAGAPSLVSFNEYTPTLVNGKWYLYDGRNYLREENNQVLLYSPEFEIYEDVVLYDWTLEIGDTLPFTIRPFDDDKSRGAVFRVTDVSTITLLDGKEYKKWTLACGIEYIEGIGAINGEGFGNYFCIQHTAHPATYIDTHLVCASRNGQLLYQMDDTEMERLGAECLCEYNNGPKKDNAKNGKIGGRPTPTQWNMLEVETKEMDGTPTILRAETFSYTLENDSIITKGKTFYQLARQSTKDTAITKSFVGALHFGEDEDNRVYFLRDGVEYVLYDFTAEPGDTIEIFAGINNYPQETTYTHVVTGKDTLENGACRMFLEVVFSEETTTIENAEKVWLAGLGSIDGIVHNAASRASDAHAAPSRSTNSSETQTSIMLCAWREDSCLYTTDHPNYDMYGCVYNQDPTAQHEIHTPSTRYQKLLRNGQLFILHNQKIYNIIGIEIK